MWVDPHPRRVGTKIMRVRSASRHKKRAHHTSLTQSPRSSHHSHPSLEHDGAAAAAAAYAADAGALDAWDAAMADDVQRHSAENINFTTMANVT